MISLLTCPTVCSAPRTSRAISSSRRLLFSLGERFHLSGAALGLACALLLGAAQNVRAETVAFWNLDSMAGNNERLTNISMPPYTEIAAEGTLAGLASLTVTDNARKSHARSYDDGSTGLNIVGAPNTPNSRWGLTRKRGELS